MELLGIPCGQFQPRKVSKKKHEVSFPPDAEVEDTSLRDKGGLFLATKRDALKKRVPIPFHPKMESSISILGL